MGVTIERSRLTVGGPSSVRNTGMSHEFLVHVDILLIDQFPQCGDFANLFEEVDFVLAIAVHGHTSGIISAILEPLKSLNVLIHFSRGHTIKKDFDYIHSGFLDEVVDISTDAAGDCMLMEAFRRI